MQQDKIDILNDNMNYLIFELKNITDKIQDVQEILYKDMKKSATDAKNMGG